MQNNPSYIVVLLAVFFSFLFVPACYQRQLNNPQLETETPATGTIAARVQQHSVQVTRQPAVPTATEFSSQNATAIIYPTLTPTAPPSATPTPEYPRYTGRPLRREDIGIQIHLHREDLRSLLRHLVTLEVGWVKVQVSWKLYEPQPDDYAEDRLAELDRLVEAATEQGIEVLLSVSKAPEWSRPTTELDGPPIDYAVYRDFMWFIADRYKEKVSAYELWNEPNLQREWNGAVLSAGDLTRLIAAGADGIRAANSEAIVISAAPAPTGINDGITAVDDRLYLQAMLESGIADYVDAIGVHPYGWANPPDNTVDNPSTSASTHFDHPSFFFLNTLSDYDRLLSEFGVDDPLWVTEFGWGSFEGVISDDGLPSEPPVGAEFMGDVSEWQQATYLLRALEIGQSNSRIGPMFIWNLNFGPLLGNEYSETGYSLLRPDNTPRAAYRMLVEAKKT